ncbi:MAG TPA: hypothetical protein DGK91_05845 [Clostridium sp.]|jgi:hypothetical protein|nr:hypothetical protein [Clostridium sp.]
MGNGIFKCSDFDSDSITKLEQYANGLILVLEDIIELISSSSDIDSCNIKLWITFLLFVIK